MIPRSILLAFGSSRAGFSGKTARVEVVTARPFTPPRARVTCVTCLVACAALSSAACGADDGGKPASKDIFSWEVTADGLDSALFSVSGTDAEDVWVVGTERPGDAGPLIAHFDGSDWEVVDSGEEKGNLYWVLSLEHDDVFAAGEDGLVLHFDGTSFARVGTPEETRDVWGIWGASSDDFWVVGGDPGQGEGFIWRGDGATVTPVELPEDAPSPSAWFKVWGVSSDDVWFCGTDGALMHFDGTSFSAVDSGTTRSLLTIHGRADGSLITAVGGQFSATVIASEDGSSWHEETPEGPPLQTFGVMHREDIAYSVGMQGTILKRSEDVWTELDPELPTTSDLHSVWISPDGDVWAVGGQILAPPFGKGVLFHGGASSIPALEF